MSTSKASRGGMVAFMAMLGMLASLALAPSASDANAGSEYQILVAFHPDWMKRHGLTRPSATPYNPKQGVALHLKRK